jgi:hypothetical protein
MRDLIQRARKAVEIRLSPFILAGLKNRQYFGDELRSLSWLDKVIRAHSAELRLVD